MRVVTWNVAGRASRQAEQAAVVMAVGADLVALQEVTKRTLPAWLAALEAAGYAHHADTVLVRPDPEPAKA